MSRDLNYARRNLCGFVKDDVDFAEITVNKVAGLTILKGKTVIYSIQYKNDWLAASDLSEMFSQSVNFHYTVHYTY